MELFRTAAATGRVPQAPELARALGRAEAEVRAALRQLAAARVLILAPMLLFRDEEHVDRWCAARDLPRGAVLSPEQAWRLAFGWYRNKVNPGWRRHTPEEAEALFDAVGLTRAFWQLRG